MIAKMGGELQKPVRSDAERRKRVNRLKKIILISILAAILLPVILCLILLFKVNKLENKVQELEQARGRKNLQELEETAAGGSTADNGMQNEDITLVEIVPVSNDEQKSDILQAGDGTPATENAGDELSKNTPDEDVALERLYEGYRKVYLTFDDGPSVYTDDILDILDLYGVKASFFVVGRTDEYSKHMYQRIAEEGHTLGMHSYTHRYQDIYASEEAFQKDIDRIHDLLYEVTGVDSKFYRFPGGSSNTVSRTDIRKLIRILNERELIYFDWNVASGDATNVVPPAEQLVENVFRHLEEYHTAVILMHDAGDKFASVEALPIIIERILQMDHTVILPLSEETIRIQHVSVDN